MVAWIASSAALSQCSMLLVPGKPTVRGMISLTNMSFVPFGFTSMLTIKSLPSPKGTLLSSVVVVGGGTRCWIGECRVCGSQSSPPTGGDLEILQKFLVDTPA